MNTKLLQGVVTLFAELTPSMSNTERMDLFKSMLPKEAAPTAPIQVNPSAQWPGALAKPVATAPKVNMAQALGLKPRQPAAQVVASPQDSVASRVMKTVAEHLGVELFAIKSTSRFIADLGADELDEVELVMAVEDEFDIELDDDLPSTVGDLINVVRRKTTTATTPPARPLVRPGMVENGRLYVNIRKHPAGFKQPTGKRKVTRLTVTGDFVEVGIGNGLQGWKISTKAQAPSYLDFIVNGEKGQKVSLPEAIAYWKRHNP